MQNYKIIRDGRTLNALSKRGFFKYPIDASQKYIDEENNPRCFEYKRKNFYIKYFDGCFFPFLCEVLNNKKYC